MPADPIASKLHRHFRTLKAKKTLKISAGCRKPKTHQLRESHILTLTHIAEIISDNDVAASDVRAIIK
jgi:hypothetical protein